MLEIVGLSRTDERIYEVLLNDRATTVSGIAAATGVSQARSRLGLRTLERRGLVSRSSGHPATYVAIDPGIALDVLLLRREEQLKQIRAYAGHLSEKFHQAVAQQDAAGLVEIISGHEVIVQRVNQLERTARHELRCLDTPPYHAGVGNDPGELEFLRRGGRARAIYDVGGIDLPDRLTQLQEAIAAGEDARVLPAIPAKLLLIDNRLAICPLRTTKAPSPSFVIVHRSALLDALSGLFEALWQVAAPIGQSGHPNAALDKPLAVEQQILGLMGVGLSDAAIAQQLRLSQRTIQRRIADLMRRLGARSRYQLGVQAARREWAGLSVQR